MNVDLLTALVCYLMARDHQDKDGLWNRIACSVWIVMAFIAAIKAVLSAPVTRAFIEGFRA